jgi:hypothetical protein
MADSNAPVAKFRVGFVTASVWKNDNSFYSVTLQRSYKDDRGEWQNADNFSHGDLLCAAKVLERAENWIASR